MLNKTFVKLAAMGCILCLSGSTFACTYSKYSLSYKSNEFLKPNKEHKYNVTHKFPAPKFSEVLNVFDDTMKNSGVHVKETLGMEPDKLLFVVSFHVQNKPTILGAFFWPFIGFTYPFCIAKMNLFYSIDVYEKSKVDAYLAKQNLELKEKAKNVPTYTDASGKTYGAKIEEINYEDVPYRKLFAPIGSYEYFRVARKRLPPVPYTIAPLFLLISTEPRAFTRITEDVVKEFITDVNNGYRAIIVYDMPRDVHGYVYPPEGMKITDDVLEIVANLASVVEAGANLTRNLSSSGGKFSESTLASTYNLLSKTADLTKAGIAAQAKSILKPKWVDTSPYAGGDVFFVVLKKEGDDYVFSGGTHDYATAANSYFGLLKNQKNIVKLGLRKFTNDKEMNRWIGTEMRKLGKGREKNK